MAEITLEPTVQSKVIPLSVRLNDTDTSLVSQLVTNRQFNTADTDAWFSFTLEGLAATTGTFDLTLINLQDKSVFNHTDKVFSTNPFYYKLDSGTDELTNEIRHAGKWVGQLVVTLANGDSATRKFIFGIEGHILDGTVVQTILLEDYNALIASIESAKDELTQYNIDYASLIGTATEQEAARLEAEELRVIADALRETKEGIRQVTFEANEVIRDGVVDSAIEGEMISQTVATKLAEKEATFAPRMLSLESELADVAEQLSATNQPIVDIGNYFATDKTNDALQELGAHKASTSNPHGVTKTQVGLGNVDNTSDANKPVSTATQTALNLKANKVQEAWFTPTLINGWVAFGGAEDGPTYYKDDFGNVKLRGVVKSGTLSVSMFKLPIGYRPTKNKYFAVISNNVPGFVLIDPSGGVIPFAGTSNVFVALDSISFKVD